MSSEWSLAFSDEDQGSGEFDQQQNFWGSAFDLEGEADFPLNETKNKDSVIFLVDFTAAMFEWRNVGEEEEGNQQQHYANTINLILAAIKKKIISSPDDEVGICLFGTRKLAVNDNSFPGIHKFQALEQPGAQMIKSIESLLQPERIEEIGPGTAEIVQFDKALWACSSMFSESGVHRTYKRIMLFTCNDEPYSDNSARLRAIQKGKDLRDLDIELELFPMNKAQSNFNFMKFFKEICYVEADESPENLNRIFQDKFEDLRNRLMKKQFKKRALGSIPLELGDNIQLAVKIYCMYREQKKDAAVMLDKETNEKVTSRTRWVSADTGEYLDPKTDIAKYYPYGGKRILQQNPVEYMQLGLSKNDNQRRTLTQRKPYFC
jgi:ATP-dependent DNA helicase 2 subunit 1